MKLFSLLSFVICICFYNCDGKHLKKDSHKIAVKQFIESTQNIEFVTLIPKQQAKIETDTVLSTQIKIKITTTCSNNDLLKIKDKSNSNIIAYRKFESKVEINRENQLIYNDIINDKKFSDSDVFWDNAILESVWVNEYKSNHNKVTLDVVFKNITDKTFRFFEIDIDKNGTQRIKPV